jgi:hypothetical protein
MIYIVEIPHQRKPFAWCAEDEEEAIDTISGANSHRDFDEQMACTEFADWIAYNASDLYAQHVFMNAADAIEGLDNISGHGAVDAVLKLRKILIATGGLPDEVIE